MAESVKTGLGKVDLIWGSGEDATTYAETGAGVSARTASGARIRNRLRTGIGKAPFSASGTRIRDRLRAGSAAIDATALGERWYTILAVVNQANTVVPLYPVVTITGACSNPTIFNPLTGEHLDFVNTVLAQGDVMTIDADDGSVEINGGRVFNYSGNFFAITGTTTLNAGASSWDNAFTVSVTLPTAERAMTLAPIRSGGGVSERVSHGTHGGSVARVGIGVSERVGRAVRDNNRIGIGTSERTGSGAKEKSTIG